ncbi:hypothetical protein [Actinokineospora iranica]|uniref:Uncharacterized protein n=1 Tax=Actinokineospora iranica TaxID=1271860 RepID=A0A1G6UPZ8_9PSEU|nr:hypothetical protein [Actinokineospora iranica]SDD43324.1 hypothetical protein SAMN05216174_11136 [Actinokineospora iranica]
MTAAGTSEPEAPDLAWPVGTAGLNEPKRALVAAAELVAAALLVWLAVWLWSRGTVPLTPIAERPDLAFERYEGNWIGAAVAAGTLALVVVLDAVRQVTLAVRARSRRT